MEEVKQLLRSVLMSSKEGVPVHVLQKDYTEITNESLPYRKYGFNSLEDFIKNMPDVVRIGRNKQGDIMCHAVANEETAHIQSLVSKQKGSRKKKHLVAPSRRKSPHYPPRVPPGPHPPTFRPNYGDRQPFPKSPFPGAKTSRSRYKNKPKPNVDFQVVVNVQANNSKRMVRYSGPDRALSAAMNAANTERKTELETVKFGHRYEVPPRFRNKGKENLPQDRSSGDSAAADTSKSSKLSSTQKSSKAEGGPHKNPSKSGGHKKPSGQISNEKVENGSRYLDRFVRYTQDNDVHWDYERLRTKHGGGMGYTTLVTMNGRNYGSGGIFGSELEADHAAAREACQQLNLSIDDVPHVHSPQSSISENELKLRIKEILAEKPNGVWSTRLPIMYSDKYKEEAPSDLERRVQHWTDMLRIETSSAIGRSIVYLTIEKEASPVKPSKETLLVSTTALCTHLQIPPRRPLIIGDKTTVYVTFIHSCTYFCVQTEDSPREEIDDKTAKLKNRSVPSLSDLREGSCVAALYSDGCWYRATVMSIRKDKVELLFVDYGNKGEERVENIRWLDEDLASYPVQAVYCSLTGIIPLEGEEFSEKSKEEFAALVTDQALTAVTKNLDDNGTCEMELYLENDTVSINQKLIDRGLVKVDIMEREVEEDTEPDDLQLPEDNQWDIYVSFVNLSTNSIMVRLIGQQYSDALEKFESKLEEAFQAGGSQEVEINEDQVYVALVDEIYQRVRVLKRESKMVEVFFLDHGDTDKVETVQIRPLDPVINKSLPYQVIEVSLHGLEDPAVSENITTLEMVFEMAVGKTLVSDVVSRDNGISLVMYDTSGEQDLNINEHIRTVVSKKLKVDTNIGSLLPELSPLPEGEQSKIITFPSVDSKSKHKTEASDYLHSHGTVASLHVDTKSDKSAKVSHGSSATHSPSKSPKSPSAKYEQKYYYINPAKAKPATDDGDDSWETESEEEEEVTVVQHEKKKVQAKKTDENSNLNVDGACKSNETQSVENSMKSLNLNKESKEKLYSWSQSDLNTKSDEWNIDEYNSWILPPKEEFPKPNSFWDVHVINVFQPTIFVCIPYRNKDILDEMLCNMIEYYNTTDSDQILKVSELRMQHMYAGHQDGAWYRILVTHVVANDLVSAYLCDYGEHTVMAIEEVKPLLKKFWHLPQQALRCKLHGIKPMKSTLWSEAAKYKFSSMAQNKSLVALVNNITDDVISLRLIDTSTEEDICLEEELLQSELAEKIQP